jgi:prepilin-type N-terminal cleavage/methylation domain-containing protein/prepilin-type processing-associated H-X9-DG protein
MRIIRKLKRGSFTLLELLVVISIIAVLAALLVPTLGQAKENAFKAKCMNNLKQIGMGIDYYLEDNDQYYPFKPPTTHFYWEKAYLMNVLGSNYFSATWDVFKCPSSKNSYSANTRTNSLGGQMDYEINSGVFGMNRFGTNGFNHGPLGNEKITIPTLAVVVYDWPGPNWYPEMGGPLNPGVDPRPHPSGGINCYFVDGHVAWVSAAEAPSSKEGQSPFYKWGRDP